jgi:hypothetical protein
MAAYETPRREDYAPITLDLILAKSIEEGDCWIWQGGCGHGTPHISENRRAVPVRRWIAQHHLAKNVAGMLATNSCGNPLCVSPDHVLVVTRARLQQLTVDRLRYHLNPARNAKLSAAARARSKFSPELIEQIRHAEGPQRAIARAFGVSFDTVNKIKAGKTYKTYGSPWQGLGARA